MQKLSDFIINHRTHFILDDKVDQLFGYQSADFVFVTMETVYNKRSIFILVTYFVSYS